MLGAPDELIGLKRTRLRWGVSFAVVVALFGSGLWEAVRWSPRVAPPPGPPEAAVMIELAPVPPAPPLPPEPPPPQPVVQPPPPLPEPAPPPPVPALPVPEPAVVIPVPPPPPAHRPERKERPVLRHPTEPPAAVAPQAPPRPPELPPAAPAAANPNAVPTWQSEILERLARLRRYPEEARHRGQEGVAQIRFSMDRRGHVLSASIAKTSGYPILDQEALAMMQRADPLPAPPPEVSGDTITLTVPIRFFLN